MIAREVIEMRQFVPGHASALAAPRNIFQEPDLRAPGPVDLFLGFWINAHVPGEQHGRQITAVGRADGPRRCRGISGEDAPGDVASCHTSSIVEMPAAKVLVPMLAPVPGSSRQTATLVGASTFAGTAAPFTHTRTRTRRGLGHSIPKKRMIAPARPLPLTPLASAMDASALDLLPPGKMAGARTSTAGSQNLSSAASRSWRCTSVRALLPSPDESVCDALHSVAPLPSPDGRSAGRG